MKLSNVFNNSIKLNSAEILDNSRVILIQIVFAYWLPVQQQKLPRYWMNGTYNWFLEIWLSQHPYGHMIAIRAFGNQIALRLFQCPTFMWLSFAIFPAGFQKERQRGIWQGRSQVTMVIPTFSLPALRLHHTSFPEPPSTHPVPCRLPLTFLHSPIHILFPLSTIPVQPPPNLARPLLPPYRTHSLYLGLPPLPT